MDINEIIIISGKGGTGKTSLTASLVPYFKDLVIADCDVDAPDLKILFEGKNILKEDFFGMKKAVINKELCINCGLCSEKCKFNAISKEIEIKGNKCEGCGLCSLVCPVKAITMEDFVTGDLFVSENDFAPLVHARLIPGEEASGKLVSMVRKTAKKIALKENKSTILVDGSPGIACNVISSITGAKKLIIVTEPSLSALHDLKRVYELSQKFRLKVFVVINKYDISLELTKEIEKYCEENSIEVGLKIPFNKIMVEAIVNKTIPSLYARELFKEINFLEFVNKLK